jgi:excisionase family DNA binding protein
MSEQDERLPLLLTIPQTAAELRVSACTVYELISDGVLEAVDIARRGSRTTRLRVPLAALEAYIASRPRVHPDKHGEPKSSRAKRAERRS